MNELQKHIEISLEDEDQVNSIYQIESKKIPYIVLVSRKNHRIQRFKYGDLCFLYSESEVIKGIKNKVLLADRIPAVKDLLYKILERDLNINTLKHHYKECKQIFNFINKYHKNANFYNISDIEEIYISYTKNLLNKIYLKHGNNENIYTENHSAKQTLIANILSVGIERNTQYLISKAKKITSQRVKNSFNFDNKFITLKKQIENLTSIFNIIYNHLINKKDLPLIFENPFSENKDKIYIDLNLINRSTNDFLKIYYNNGNIETIENYISKIKENYGTDRVLLKEYLAKYTYRTNRINKLNQISFIENNTRILLSNFLTITFAKLLIASTSANESVLYNLRLDSFLTIASQKGKRAIAVKCRAGNKKISLEFGVRFKEIYNKFINFRKYINEIYQSTIPEKMSELLFIKLPTHNISCYGEIMQMDQVMFDSYQKSFSKVFKNKSPLNKDLRLYAANYFLNNTNNLEITAKKLGNTTSTVRNKYIHTTFEEVAKDFTSYFAKMNTQLLKEDRKSKQIIPVNISIKNQGKNIPIGHCIEGSPTLRDEFNEKRPIPNCTDINSCIDCKNYIFHLDSIDIRKIISYRSILQQINTKKLDIEKKIFRINEILKFIKTEYPHISGLILTIEKEVEKGFLDKFWENHLNLLLELGVINE